VYKKRIESRVALEPWIPSPGSYLPTHFVPTVIRLRVTRADSGQRLRFLNTSRYLTRLWSKKIRKQNILLVQTANNTHVRLDGYRTMKN
jgi:hypothetical protein